MTTRSNTDFHLSDQNWTIERWVVDLLERHPQVVSICKRKGTSGPFKCDTCLVVMISQGITVHRWFSLVDEYNSIYVDASLRDVHNTRWLEGCPRADDLQAVVKREDLGLGAPIALSDNRGLVLHENGGWMLEILERFPQIVSIGKAASILTSPHTYMFRRAREDGVHVVTWMKEPDVGKFTVRMKSARARWDGWHDDQLMKCGFVFERAEIYAFHNLVDKMTELQRSWERQREAFNNLKCCLCDAPPADGCRCIAINGHPALGMQAYCATCIKLPNAEIAEKFAARQKQERIAQGYERLTGKEVELDSVDPACAGCGCSLKTNRSFGGGRQSSGVCGECLVAKEGAATAARGPIYQEPPLKKPSKFDPRPGIDDTGLGFYSPTWED